MKGCVQRSSETVEQISPRAGVEPTELPGLLFQFEVDK